jgi:hypothetical protein
MWKDLVRKGLGLAGYAVWNTRNRYADDGLLTMHGDQFRRDPDFQKAYARGMQATHGIDPKFEWRAHVALWAASRALRVPGDFVECGVNAGFVSSAIMHRLNWRSVDRRFFLVDTFSGPVLSQYSANEVGRGRRRLAEEALAAGAYVTDLDRIVANYSEWPNAVVVQGAVPEVLPALDIRNVAFLHIDMNCAYPEQAALEFFWDRLSPGALVLFDDYSYFGHVCQNQAISETARRLGTEVLSLPTGQGLIIR